MFQSLRRMFGSESSRSTHAIPSSTPASSRRSNSTQSRTAAVGPTVIPTTSSSTYPPTSYGLLNVTYISEAEMERQRLATIASLEEQSCDDDYINDVNNVEENAFLIADFIVDLDFMHIDGETEQQKLKSDLTQFLSLPDVSNVIKFKMKSEDEMKIIVYKGGCEKLLRFVDQHPEIQYCRFDDKAVETFLRTKVRGELAAYMTALHARNLLAV